MCSYENEDFQSFIIYGVSVLNISYVCHYVPLYSRIMIGLTDSLVISVTFR